MSIEKAVIAMILVILEEFYLLSVLHCEKVRTLSLDPSSVLLRFDSKFWTKCEIKLFEDVSYSKSRTL